MCSLIVIWHIPWFPSYLGTNMECFPIWLLDWHKKLVTIFCDFMLPLEVKVSTMNPFQIDNLSNYKSKVSFHIRETFSSSRDGNGSGLTWPDPNPLETQYIRLVKDPNPIRPDWTRTKKTRLDPFGPDFSSVFLSLLSCCLKDLAL